MPYEIKIQTFAMIRNVSKTLTIVSGEGLHSKLCDEQHPFATSPKSPNPYNKIIKTRLSKHKTRKVVPSYMKIWLNIIFQNSNKIKKSVFQLSNS